MIGDCDYCGHSAVYHLPFVGCTRCDYCDEYVVRLVTILPLMLLLSACNLTMNPPTVVCDEKVHVWGDEEGPFHLGPNDLSPVIVNNSDYEIDIDSWNDLDTPVQLRMDGDGFIITVTEGHCDKCLGMASITIDADKHLTSAAVLLDRVKLDKYESENPGKKVVCQEVGHIITLGHQKGAPDSCMNECKGPSYEEWLACMSGEEGTTPNPHDGELMMQLYDGHHDESAKPDCVGTLVIHTFGEWGG